MRKNEKGPGENKETAFLLVWVNTLHTDGCGGLLLREKEKKRLAIDQASIILAVSLSFFFSFFRVKRTAGDRNKKKSEKEKKKDPSQWDEPTSVGIFILTRFI